MMTRTEDLVLEMARELATKAKRVPKEHNNLIVDQNSKYRACSTGLLS